MLPRRAWAAAVPEGELKTGLLIVGGGVIGGSMALLAAAEGIECVLVERGKPPARETSAEDARVFALSLASQKILSAIGVWRQLAPADVGRFERMQVWDETGRAELDFDKTDVNRPALAYSVRQTVLNRALAAVREKTPAVTICAGASPTVLHAGGKDVRLELSDGRRVSAKLLIAADGTNSAIRQLAGIDYEVREYQQTALASIVRTMLPHENVARQRFLRTGPVAFLPLADRHCCGVVWSTAPAQAAALLETDKTGFHRLLEEALESRLGAILDSGPRQGFPLQRAQARHYCADRIALIGDAAHCVHPLAGLGANLGLLDAASLCQVLGRAGREGRDFGGRTTLRKYERWRKGENFMVMMALEGIKYLFENQVPPVPGLRNAGMGLFNSFRALKNFTIRRATGLSGDMPDIARNASE